jgi:hypothetical protein
MVIQPTAVLHPPTDVTYARRLLAELAADPNLRDRYGVALRDVHRGRFSVERDVSARLDAYRCVAR